MAASYNVMQAWGLDDSDDEVDDITENPYIPPSSPSLPPSFFPDPSFSAPSTAPSSPPSVISLIPCSPPPTNNRHHILAVNISPLELDSSTYKNNVIDNNDVSRAYDLTESFNNSTSGNTSPHISASISKLSLSYNLNNTSKEKETPNDNNMLVPLPDYSGVS